MFFYFIFFTIASVIVFQRVQKLKKNQNITQDLPFFFFLANFQSIIQWNRFLENNPTIAQHWNQTLPSIEAQKVFYKHKRFKDKKISTEELSFYYYEFFKDRLTIPICMRLLEMISQSKYYAPVSDYVFNHFLKTIPNIEKELFLPPPPVSSTTATPSSPLVNFFASMQFNTQPVATEVPPYFTSSYMASFLLRTTTQVSPKILEKLQSFASSPLLDLTIQWFQKPSLTLLLTYFPKLTLDHQYNLMPLFAQFPHEQSLVFLNQYIHTKNLLSIFHSKKYLEQELENKAQTLMAEMAATHPIEKQTESYAFCCFRRPKIHTLSSINYLVCPLCGDISQIQTGYPFIRLTLQERTEQGFLMCYQAGKIETKEGDELIVNQINGENMDKLLVAFYEDCANFNINQHIRYVITLELALQENTKRILGISNN